MKNFIATKFTNYSLVILCSLLLVVASASAASTISSGFTSNQPLSSGTVVSLSQSDSGAVVPATSNTEVLIGVVVGPNTTLVELNNDTTNTQVVTEGEAEVWVSNLNGPIKAGDTIAPSLIEGIATKTSTQPQILGVAQEEFDPANPEQIEKDITADVRNASIEHEGEIKIGKIRVTVAITDNPEIQNLSGIPGLIQNVNERLTDTGVSPVRVILAFIVFIAATTISGVLIYGTVKNSIISIGRNPLSKRSIYVGLAQVSLIGTVIMGIAFLASYLLLTR